MTRLLARLYKPVILVLFILLPFTLGNRLAAGRTEMQILTNRGNTLGYEAGVTFEPQPELQTAVNFWKRIYTQYTTKQSVIHDSLHLQVIYTAVDFSSIQDNPNLSDKQKRKI